MLTNTADDIGTEPTATASVTNTINETEQTLATEITQLWAVHTDAQYVVKKSQAELKAIRQSLGGRLYAMKQILARPGRAGQWSSFLEQRGISRTTADRLVAGYVKLLGTDENGTTGSVSDLSDEQIAELAKAVWKKLGQKLGTKRAAYTFLARLIAESGVGNFKFTRANARGLALVDPAADSTPQVTAPATTDIPEAVPTNAA
jgi:hypothetical protein